jgi:hypothetical protein
MLLKGILNTWNNNLLRKNKVYGKLLRVGFKIKYFIYEDFYNKSG